MLKELSRYQEGTWADIIYRDALLYPDREAFVFEDTRITFSEYNLRVNKLINALLTLNCKTGDIIGILSWNCLQFADVYGATMKGGFIASPFNPRLKENELEYIINESGAGTIFVGPELVDKIQTMRSRLTTVKNFITFENNIPDMISHEKLLASTSGEEPDVQVEKNTPVCIIYTSGTTGTPRGALYTQSRFIEDSKTLAINMSLRAGHKRIQITPLFHMAGNSHFRSSLYTGGCNVLCKTFDAEETLRLIESEKATHIDCVPTHVIAMLNVSDLKKYDLSSLEMMWYGGSPMPLEVVKKGIRTFRADFCPGVRAERERSGNLSFI